MQPGQQPTPEQIQMMQRQLAADAAKQGVSVPEFIEMLKKQQQARQQQMQQQQQQGGGGGGGPAPPQRQPQPITPGPPNPAAIAVANFLKSQDLKPRTCILNGQRKDMFKGKPSIRPLLPLGSSLTPKKSSAHFVPSRAQPMRRLALRTHSSPRSPTVLPSKTHSSSSRSLSSPCVSPRSTRMRATTTALLPRASVSRGCGR